MKNSNYHDIRGYQYGLCDHSEDFGEEIECPQETTACGKISLSVDKKNAQTLLNQVKDLLPDSRSRRELEISRLKSNILRVRGRRPNEGVYIFYHSNKGYIFINGTALHDG